MENADQTAFVREMYIRLQIQEALLRYCRGADRLDREILLSAYHPGARDNHGSFDGPCEAFADWLIDRHTRSVEACSHFVTNTLIQFEGDVAFSESYVVTLQRTRIDGGLFDLVGGGRYVDRFEERGGEWRIADRLVVYDWDRLEPVTGEWGGPLTKALIPGVRSREDPSYKALRPRT